VGPKRHAFSRQKAGWSVDGRALLASAADDLMTAVLDVESKTFLEAAAREKLGSRPADVEVAVQLPAGQSWKMSFHAYRGDFAAMVSRRPGAFAVARDAVDRLREAIEKASAAPAATPVATPS
jgi:hypothetical protein